MARAQVRLNVYDMYWLNDYASNIGVGIFHSGIEVYGVEYAYGGHPYNFSGVFENSPQDSEELGDNFKFKESILIGETDFTASDVRDLIKTLGHDFKGDKYHLINRNCNHFSAVLAKTLSGKDIPNWINRLANISGSIPFLEKWLPQEWLTPVALQQSMNHPTPSSSTPSSGRSTTGTRLATTAGPGPIEKAVEATESIRNGRLDGRQDSRTTVLSGVSGGEMSSSASSSSDESGGRASPSTVQRFIQHIRNTVN